VKLFSKISDAWYHNPPTLQTDRWTERQLTMTIPRYATLGKNDNAERLLKRRQQRYHVVVVARLSLLQFFVLDVVVNSVRLSDDNIYAQLKRIVQMAEEGRAEGNDDQVGILTGVKRNVWAAARKLLVEGTSV